MNKLRMSAKNWCEMTLSLVFLAPLVVAQERDDAGVQITPGTSEAVGSPSAAPPEPSSAREKNRRSSNGEQLERGRAAGSGVGPGDPDRRFDRGEGPPPWRGGGGRDRGEMFRRLSEDERQKVRSAFEKVWVRPEVEAARTRLREANDDYRKVIDEALLAVDPEVVKLLNRARPPLPPMPANDDPEFVNKMMERLRSEGPPRGNELHEKLMQHPTVQQLMKNFKEADLEQRRRAWEELREGYFRAMREHGRASGFSSGTGSEGRRDGKAVPKKNEISPESSN